MLKRDKMLWGVLFAEMGHILCCGIPGLFSLLSLLAGIGIISTVPAELDFMHEIIHHYEGYIILGSFVVLMTGWVFFFIARKMDCSTQVSCNHAPCDTKKDFSKIILIVASILFALNASFYLFIHS